MTRTSLTHPLKIDTVACGAGEIGMTFCPGKKGPSLYDAPWDRDLGADMRAVAAWRPAAVVTLMEESEFGLIGVPDLGAAMKAAGFDWYHLPIVDLSTPDATFERRWVYFGQRLRETLRSGGRVLIHCRGGLGRTGLLAARLLIELGEAPETAIAKVRAARPGAVETAAQEAYVSECAPPIWTEAFADRVLGCLMGGAVGDAFGYAVEFQSLDEIRAGFGSDGLTEPVLKDGASVVSDDTQMTLFTAEGLARAFAGAPPHATPGNAAITKSIREAYFAWLETQTGAFPQESPPAGLQRYPQLWKHRAPGGTCLSALRAGGRGTPEARFNNSKGCGGVMRVAPIGLVLNFEYDPDRAFDLAVAAAAITHGHPSGYLSAGFLAAMIRGAFTGHSLHWGLGVGVEGMIGQAAELLPKRYGHAETLAAVEAAQYLSSTDMPIDMAIRRLGQGWVGEEALAIAIYAVLKADGFQETLRIAANHDGDSDSTASIAGQIWGAAHGLSGIPDPWIRQLDVFDALCDVARQMLTIPGSVCGS